MNISNLRRNEVGELVDINGNKIFGNGVFNSLMSYDHISATTPAAQYIDAQADQAFFPYSDDARKYIDINCSKLLDDNASLANPDISVKNTYLADVACFLAIVNKICDNDNVKNTILGDTFTTKNDDSEDSKIPIYLCIEILKAKCLSYFDRAISPVENFNLTDSSLQTSNFNAEFDKVIEKTKQLSYNKEYFGQDINDVTQKWLSACQIDATGSVDLYAKCDATQCLVFVTQKVIENGQEVLNEKSSPMFEVKYNTIEPVVTNDANIGSQDIFQNVTVVDNPITQEQGVVNKEPEATSNIVVMSDYKAQLINLKAQLDSTRKQEAELQNQIDQLVDKMVAGVDSNVSVNDNDQISHGMVA